ncbi:hypothetical protein M413DRAFT_147377 [Hebeloma cylindrosporum]|uniref:Uncharacterized protein n=1 Tax=Hebeloma cylindrosporum TaxID=76867 RepID=A0A0C3CCM4_HEBCY|nr:hypothetical protein M413DRAFT_147377 [Hebeloma cylindrosporum h7]
MSRVPVKCTSALSNACRGQSSSRFMHSAPVNHARILSSTTPITAPQLIPEEIILQPIPDIFDAPIGLGESTKFIRDQYSSAPNLHVHELPSRSSPNPHGPRPLPTPLPPPIIFDGPARPKSSALANQRRVLDKGLPPSSQPRRNMDRPPLSARPFSSSEPLVQLFEGPARITTYHHHQPRRTSSEKKNLTRLVVALGVAGVVGCAKLAKDTEKS